MTNPTAWIQLSAGKQFWVTDPQPDVIDIKDIARALSRIPRFGGHTHEFYSVAQHSVLGSYLVPEHLAMAFLLHDAAEAYGLGDICKPVKDLLGDRVHQLEGQILDTVYKRFNVRVSDADRDQIKHADLVMMAAEAEILMDTDIDQWGFPESVLDDKVHIDWIDAWPAPKAETAFRRRFLVLLSERVATGSDPVDGFAA